MIRGISDDFRFAYRTLRAAPIVTMVAVLTLALGIGALTAVFSVVNGLILRTLAVKDPQRLVTVTSNTALNLGFQAGAGWSYAMWDRLRSRRDAFEGAFAWMIQRVDVAEGGEMQPVEALFASGELFTTLGVPAVVGRTFTSADDVRGGGPDGAVAVISHRFWQRRFNGVAGIIGTRIPIEGVPFTIIGVTPREFVGVDVGQGFDVALPFGTEPLIRGPRTLLDAQNALLLTVMLRLKAQQSIAEGTAILQAMQPQIVGVRRETPAFLKEPFTLVPAATGISDRSGLRQKYSRPLLAIAIVAGLVLITICVNIANLLLAHAAARRQELSVRLALGASRLRLARQFLAESLALGTLAAVLGLMFAVWVSRGLVAQLPAAAGQALLDVSLDWRVLGFAAGITIAAVAFFGTIPAFHAASIAATASLREEGRTASGASSWAPLSGGLIVAQVAISLVLVAAAGLFVRTLDRLSNVPLGFDPDGVLVITMNTGRSTIEPAMRLSFFQRVVDGITSVPGVTQAAGSLWTPMGGGGGGLLTDARGRRADSNQAAFNFVTPGWFETYGTVRRAGRDISASDSASTPRVAIVNESLGRKLFQERSAIGQTIEAGPCGERGCTVVGVVGDAVYSASLRDGPPPTVYLPLMQSAGLTPPGSASLRVSVRATGDPLRLVPTLTAALRDIDPRLTFTFRPLDRDVASSVAQERMVATLAAFFGLLALLLSGLGLYGVVAHAVSRRRAEIGIRLALGAQPNGVVGLMLRRVTVFGAAGMAIGLGASLWLARFIAPLVFGLESRDPVTLLMATLTLAAVATCAAWLPASRAARLDPAVVLREK